MNGQFEDDDSDGSVTIGRGKKTKAARGRPTSRAAAPPMKKKPNRLYTEPTAQTNGDGDIPARTRPEKMFPIGTRFMNLLNTKEPIGTLDNAETFSKGTSKTYDSFYLHVLRERFNVTTRTDGNVYAYIEMNDDEANGTTQTGVAPDLHRANDDIVFLVPPTRILYHTIFPPPTSDEIQDRVDPILVRFVRMVAGATGDSIKYLIVTNDNQKSENPKLKSQRVMHDPDPLEHGGDFVDDDAHARGARQGFFDAADLDDDDWDASPESRPWTNGDDENDAEDETQSAQPTTTIEHSNKSQHRVVRDALRYTALLYSEDDAGNQRMYRPIGASPPPVVDDNHDGWVHDRYEQYSSIPDITHFAVKSRMYTDANLFSANLIFTMATASALVKQNAPGFRESMWIRDERTTFDTDNNHRFNLGSILTESKAFDASTQWLKNIIRSFMLRYVLEFRREHAQSGMTPARFWMYHYSETDIGMVALAILGLTQVPNLRNNDKARVGALANILCAILTSGSRKIVKKFEDETNDFPDLLVNESFVGKFAHLTALVMSRSEGNFTKNGQSYVPNGELPRLQREISYILRWFTQQQTNSHYRRQIPGWLKSY